MSWRGGRHSSRPASVDPWPTSTASSAWAAPSSSPLIGEDNEDIASAHGGFLSELRPYITSLPGASELVRHVKARGGLVVMTTSANQHEIPGLLGVLGVNEVIDAVIGGDDAERAKPHPDLFSLALSHVSLDPSDVLALGDTVWDVQAAGRAGIGCVGVTSGGIAKSELRDAGALAVYNSCAEVLREWIASPIGELLEL